MPEAATAHTRAFEEQRPRLFAIAYRMLGSVAEAEDAVQDTYLRWVGADHCRVEVPAAWLTAVLVNLCRTRLTSARAVRETYPGPWLPEPVVTAAPDTDPQEAAVRRETVSMAVLALLERLTPAERAVFVLREAFAYPHREIAAVLELSEANSQQLYHRARSRIEADRPRFSVTDDQARRTAEEFLRAAREGDVAALERLLHADVVAQSDGGGRVHAARKTVRGVERVARYLLSWTTRQLPRLEVAAAEVNGQPGFVALSEGRGVAAMVLEIHGGLVTAVRTVVNPDKLRYVAAQAAGGADAARI
ncbi:RNA polymerase sigma-70 factor [Streptomonospora nanhaiensis]|uniref:RNA polymerase sigma-70 factor (ECF subfamily) n=1 Tax=Streptomonospora nanhaiensis TaxID=1323731 RepID=A0A853BND2_9ACTN|nr:RNA polymerase sigma-70 factor [Streptomonospora nanhaiensis]MBV2362048.1 RNA polymerase sigma-70 factor [Streptomonospora nanhaiensis]MBX9391319.1 RNA polymerase sigma-70 factor [Streptomonospora nanhaiensis]NYI96126.1 RNA polymerase sigma-70 factor (ECF subfamily) [Streptomonospora nanhaiensis]